MRTPDRRLRFLPPLAQNLLLSLASALVFGAAVEGVARLMETRRPPTPPVAESITRWGEGESEFYTIKSTATGWPPWEDYNSEGVRDREHAVAKPPGVRRIACLGDSVTLGTGLAAEDAWPQRLQDRLDAMGAPVEVLNVALGGWATRQERAAYERIARKYRPDVVLLGVCLNDIAELHNNLTRPPRLLGALYLRSAAVRWAVGAHEREIRAVDELFESRDSPRVRDAFRRFFAEVEALQKDVQRDGATLAVVVFPFRGQMTASAPPPSVQEEIASFCHARLLPVLDLRAALLELGAGAFADEVHLTAEGTERVAETIAESDLIPGGAAGAGIRDGAGRAEGSERRIDVAALLEALGHPDGERRAAAAQALGNAHADPARAVRALARTLGDASARARAGAAWGLGGYRGDSAPALAGLVSALDDEDAAVRAGAAWALGRIGPPAQALAARALVQRLADSDANVRRRAGDALVRVGAKCEGCVSALVQIVARVDGPGRPQAAWALGALGPAARAAVPALASALVDVRPEVRSRAAWAPGRVGPAAAVAVTALLALVEDPVIGWHAIDALGGIGPGAAAAAPRLCRALHDPSSSVRWRAAQALGQLGPAARAAAPDLVSALDDDEANVRLAAANAMVRIDAAPAAILPALARALRDADSRVRCSAAHGFAHLGSAARHHVIDLLAATHDPDPLVRAATARALHRIGPSVESRSVLADLASRDPDEAVRAAARQALRPQHLANR